MIEPPRLTSFLVLWLFVFSVVSILTPATASISTVSGTLAISAEQPPAVGGEGDGVKTGQRIPDDPMEAPGEIADLREYCNMFFAKHRKCPNDLCNIGCLGGLLYENCPVTCSPKPCHELPVGQCPSESCQIVEDCDGEPVCYEQMNPDSPACGGMAYAGQDVPCCEGFVKRCGVEFFDGTCDMKPEKSVHSIPMCLPCGNGICNQFENACNCPEDCAKDKIFSPPASVVPEVPARSEEPAAPAPAPAPAPKLPEGPRKNFSP